MTLFDEPLLGTWVTRVEGSLYGSFETLHTFTPGGGWVGTGTDQPPLAHGNCPR